MTFDEAFALSTDSDEDGLVDLVDNCLVVPNPDQLDKNEDGIGDICYVLELAREDLAKRLDDVDTYEIHPVKVEGVTWQSTCLGYASGADCSPVATPGYRAVFMVHRVRGVSSVTVKHYLYHTDQNVSFRFIGPVENVKDQFPVWRGPKQ